MSEEFDDLLDDIVIEQYLPQSPDDMPVKCTDEDCGWAGKLGECPTGWDQDGWENPPYRVALCPKCGEQVDF